jgi:hypothetical protein
MTKLNNKIDSWMRLIQDKITLYLLKKRNFEKEIPFLKEIYRTQNSVEYNLNYIGDIRKYSKCVSEEDIDFIDNTYDHIRIRVLNSIQDEIKSILSLNDIGKYPLDKDFNTRRTLKIYFGHIYTVIININIMQLAHQWVVYRAAVDGIVDVDKFIHDHSLRDAVQSQKTKLECYRQNILF